MEMNRQLKGETGSMTQQTITAEMTVFAVLDRVPGAIELFQQHGVNPAGECAFFTRQIRLKETRTLPCRRPGWTDFRAKCCHTDGRTTE